MMDQNPLISVVVPVYNVESTLERCIESLTNQTYHHLEILLVNDGSTDRSGDICRRLASSDRRICVLTQKNQGLSAARNTGVAHARGEFVTFVDSDDYVDSSFIETLVNETRKNPQIDLVICGFMTNNPAFHEKEAPNNYQIMPGRSYLEKCLENPPIYDIVAWTKLYRTSLCRQIPFPPGRIHEDEFTYYRFIGESRFIATVPESLYHYIFNQQGITSTETAQGLLDKAEAFRQRLDYQVSHHFSCSSINQTARGVIGIILYARYQHPEMTQSEFSATFKQCIGQSLIPSLQSATRFLSLTNKAVSVLLLHAPVLLYSLYAVKHRVQSTIK